MPPLDFEDIKLDAPRIPITERLTKKLDLNGGELVLIRRTDDEVHLVVISTKCVRPG